jgi:penicillin-binding protein A
VIGSLTGTIRRLTVFVALLFIALLVNINIVQVGRAGSLANGPGNSRGLIQEFKTQRGPILAGGEQIALSQLTNGTLKYQRVYPNGSVFAPATGFFSIIYGRTGIERVEDQILSGNDPRFSLQQVSDLIAGRTRKGGSVLLTLNVKAQMAAAEAMKGKVGAVVALDPSTGAILALVSNPSYDPNLLASHNSNTQIKAWNTLIKDPAQPLLNRPLAQVYPPGSTFKLVTLSAALSSGKYTTTSQIPAPARLHLPQTTSVLINDTGQQCLNGTVTLAQALAVSCNTAFAQVGMTVGGQALEQQAEAYGFNHSFDVPMTAATSRFPQQTLSPPQVAQSAIGQFDVRATALQMAMVGAAIANGGVVNEPYLVQEVRAPDLSVLETARVKEYGRAISSQIAAEITTMMEGVVSSSIGTGHNAQIPNVNVAGKTGTAQTAPGQPDDAWFVAFAPSSGSAGGPQVAVAVIVEGAPNQSDVWGGRLAAPVAKAVIQAVLAK